MINCAFIGRQLPSDTEKRCYLYIWQLNNPNNGGHKIFICKITVFSRGHISPESSKQLCIKGVRREISMMNFSSNIL